MSLDQSQLIFTFVYVKVESGVEIKLKSEHITGEHVLVVEDVYDTGKSMSLMLKSLTALSPKSLKSAVLFHKRNPINLDLKFKAEFIGFTIPIQKYIVGYHLDYYGFFREIPHLCVLNEAGLKEFKK